MKKYTALKVFDSARELVKLAEKLPGWATVICVILFSIAHILSLQDVTIRSMFCALFYQIVCW